MPRLDSKNEKLFVSTAADVAQCYGVTTDTVKRWRADGMPGTPKHYVLADISKWLRTDGPWSQRSQQIKTDDPLLADGDSPGLERYRLAKAKHAELDLEARKGELIEMDKCRDVLSRWAVVIRRMGERLVKRYGSTMSAEIDQTLHECQLIVKEELSVDGDD